jgi:hypothetical protein
MVTLKVLAPLFGTPLGLQSEDTFQFPVPPFHEELTVLGVCATRLPAGTSMTINKTAQFSNRRMLMIHTSALLPWDTKDLTAKGFTDDSPK